MENYIDLTLELNFEEHPRNRNKKRYCTKIKRTAKLPDPWKRGTKMHPECQLIKLEIRLR